MHSFQIRLHIIHRQKGVNTVEDTTWQIAIPAVINKIQFWINEFQINHYGNRTNTTNYRSDDDL